MANEQILTPTQLDSLTQSNEKSQSGQNLLAEFKSAVQEVNSLIANWKSLQATYGSIKGQGVVKDDVNIASKIEKGIEQRSQNSPQPKPQKEPKIAIHVGHASEDFCNFLKQIAEGIDEEESGKKIKEELIKQADSNNLSPIVEGFIRKHTEVYYE